MPQQGGAAGQDYFFYFFIVTLLKKIQSKFDFIKNRLKTLLHGGGQDAFRCFQIQSQILFELISFVHGDVHIGGDSFENAKTFPTIPQWPQISDILSRAISNMATGEDAQSQLDAAAIEIEKLLQE